MYHKVLVPLHDSDDLECILRHVKEIVAGYDNPEIILLKIIEPFSPLSFAEVNINIIEEQEQEEVEVRNRMSLLAEKLKSKGMNIRTEVIRGWLSDEIMTYAIRNGVDLIVLGTNKVEGLARWLRTNEDRVMHESAVPVMVISPGVCPHIVTSH